MEHCTQDSDSRSSDDQDESAELAHRCNFVPSAAEADM